MGYVTKWMWLFVALRMVWNEAKRRQRFLNFPFWLGDFELTRGKNFYYQFYNLHKKFAYRENKFTTWKCFWRELPLLLILYIFTIQSHSWSKIVKQGIRERRISKFNPIHHQEGCVNIVCTGENNEFIANKS